MIDYVLWSIVAGLALLIIGGALLREAPTSIRRTPPTPAPELSPRLYDGRLSSEEDAFTIKCTRKPDCPGCAREYP
jgi:hypothetical protein